MRLFMQCIECGTWFCDKDSDAEEQTMFCGQQCEAEALHEYQAQAEVD